MASASDHGQCGACTVIVNGERINSCLSLTVQHQGDKVTTIEGLGRPDKLHPMQATFVKHDGYQCGHCTPGQICSAVSVLDDIKRGLPSHVQADLTDNPGFTNIELRERMSGNIPLRRIPTSPRRWRKSQEQRHEAVQLRARAHPPRPLPPLPGNPAPSSLPAAPTCST